MSTLFEQLGGEGAISAVVDKFYVFMLADPSVAHFFESVNMAKQAVRQKQFITMVTGGPCNYEGKDMKAAHEKLPINKAHFDQTWHHLEQALTFYAVPQNLIQEVRNVFYSVETMIVNQVCQQAEPAPCEAKPAEHVEGSKCQTGSNSNQEAHLVSEKSVQDSEPTKYHPEAIKCPARQEDPTTESQDKECLSQIESFPEGDKGETEKQKQSGPKVKLSNEVYQKHFY